MIEALSITSFFLGLGANGRVSLLTTKKRMTIPHAPPNKSRSRGFHLYLGVCAGLNRVREHSERVVDACDHRRPGEVLGNRVGLDDVDQVGRAPLRERHLKTSDKFHTSDRSSWRSSRAGVCATLGQTLWRNET